MTKGNSSNNNHLTQDAKSRIMATQSKNNGGQTPKGSFAARAQSAADSYQAAISAEAANKGKGGK